jgi:hypothetical protein
MNIFHCLTTWVYSLVVLAIQPCHGQHRKQHFQEHLCSCMFIRWCGNMIIMPLPSNGRIYSFHYSSFQPSCHIAPSLRLLISCSLQVYHHFFIFAGLCLWRRQLFSWMTPQRRASSDASAFGPDDMLPSFLVGCCCSPTAPCSLFRVAHFERYDPVVVGLQSSIQAPSLVVGLAFLLKLDEWPWSETIHHVQGVLPAARPRLYHTPATASSLLLFIQGDWTQLRPWGPQRHFLMAQMHHMGTSNPQMHCGCAWHSVPGSHLWQWRLTFKLSVSTAPQSVLKKLPLILDLFWFWLQTALHRRVSLR